jgi:protein-disulfide isomerase
MGMKSDIKKGQAEGKFLAASILVASVIVAGSIIWATRSIQSYLEKGGANVARAGAPGQPVQPPQPQPQPQQPPSPPPEVERIDMSQIAPPPPYRIKGDPNAKVTIVEYSDFQCPFCGRWARETLPQILQTYGDKVKIVFKHLPLPFHQFAQKAAEAAECAGKIGGAKAFWAMHDKLFQVGLPQGRLDVASLKQFAKEIGLDEKRFSQCLDTGETAQIVMEDMNESQRLGVRGTPTFFINGIPVRGALPFEAFKQVIDQELQRGG